MKNVCLTLSLIMGMASVASANCWVGYDSRGRPTQGCSTAEEATAALKAEQDAAAAKIAKRDVDVKKIKADAEAARKARIAKHQLDVETLKATAKTEKWNAGKLLGEIFKAGGTFFQDLQKLKQDEALAVKNRMSPNWVEPVVATAVAEVSTAVEQVVDASAEVVAGEQTSTAVDCTSDGAGCGDVVTSSSRSFAN